MENDNEETMIRGLLGWGAVAAMILSWSRNASVGWMLLHGVCTWFYVAYVVWFA